MAASVGERARALAGTPRDWITWKGWRLWAVLFVLAYTLAGFFALPPLIKDRLTTELTALWDRPVRVEAVRTNPFRLSLDIRGFAVTETDGAPLVAADRAFVRVGLLGLLQWAAAFDVVRIEGLDVSLVRDADGSLNVEALVPPSDTSEPPDEDVAAELPRLVFGEIALTDARVRLTDATRPTPFETAIGPVDLALRRISTLPRREGDQAVVIKTENGGRIAWEGTASLQPLAASGSASVVGPYAPILHRYLQDDLGFVVSDGDVLLGLTYALETREDQSIALDVADIGFVLRDLRVQSPDGERLILIAPEFAIAAGRVALPEQDVSVEEVALRGARVEAWRNADGTLFHERMVATPEAAPPAETPTDGTSTDGTPPAASDDPMAGWSVRLDRVAIEDFSARFEDLALREPGAVELADLDLVVEGLTTTPEARAPMTLNAALAAGGRLDAQGGVVLAPTFAADLRVTGDGLAVAAVEPYLRDAARLSVGGGALSWEADVALSDTVTVDGGGRLEDLALSVKDSEDRLLSWDKVAVDRFRYASADDALELSEVVIDGPYVRLTINEDLTTNFQALTEDPARVDADAADDAEQPDDVAAAPVAEAQDAPPVPDAPAANAPTTRVTVARLALSEGAMDFTDLSLPFPFAARIADLGGELTSLDTASTEPAAFRLEGQVSDYGQARIEGATPLADPTLDTDVSVLFRNIDIADLSPYTIKFAGREIAEGRMELDLRYRVEAGGLLGENNIVISDIALGERVNQPGAMRLPLALAIGLLKDAEGKIDVDIPVRGDVNDPQFRIGGVIAKAIINLIRSVATSPFRLLGNLVGVEGEDFGVLAFEPGRAAVSPPDREKLVKLAEALALRPTLTIVTPAPFDAEADAEALRALRVDARVEEAVAARREGEASDEFLSALRREALEGAFREQFPDIPLETVQAPFLSVPDDRPRARPELDAVAYLAAVRAQLIAAEEVTEADLAALAGDRASAAIDVLVTEGAVDATRVSAAEPAEAKQGERGDVLGELSLTGVDAAAPEPTEPAE